MMDDLEDADRRLERRALRNVRGLLDKLEAEDRRRGPSVTAVLIAMVVVVGGVALIFAIADAAGLLRREAPDEIRSPDTWRPTPRYEKSPETPSANAVDRARMEQKK
jgi:hypothetical protein